MQTTRITDTPQNNHDSKQKLNTHSKKKNKRTKPTRIQQQE